MEIIFFVFNSSVFNMLAVIVENSFEPETFGCVLEILIENEVGKISNIMYEFSLVESADFIVLFEKIKETVHFIAQDINQFLINASKFANG